MIPIAQTPEKSKSPTTLHDPPPPEPPPPDRDLLGIRDNYHKFCVPESIRGDCVGKRPNLVGFGISENYDPALHIAATTNNSKSVEEFVENLVSLLTMEQLELQNKSHNTAVCIVAAYGYVVVVKTMVNKNMALVDIPPDIPGSQGMRQLYMSCSNKMTGEFWTRLNRGWVLQKCVEADLFDVAVMRNTEFLVELIRHYPELLWKTNDDEQTIFHVAVTHLHEGIYNLLYEIGSMKDMITPLNDEEGNNMLHLVGKTDEIALQEVSGVLQMQRELLWFKEVEVHDGTLCK